MSELNHDVDPSHVLDLFFRPDRLECTLNRLVQGNRIFRRDPLFEILNLVFTSITTIALVDRGLAFFCKDLSVCLSYKNLKRDELTAVVALLRTALRNKTFYINQQRGGGICVQFTQQDNRLISHYDLLMSVYSMIMHSSLSLAMSKSQMANVVFQRLNNAVHIDKQAFCAVQRDLARQQSAQQDTLK